MRDVDGLDCVANESCPRGWTGKISVMLHNPSNYHEVGILGQNIGRLRRSEDALREIVNT